MELRHLRYFVAVAELENFRRAAQRLHIVQPALSRQIRILEGELGVQLFERSARGATLSAVGRTFLDDARRILDEAEQAVSRARRAALGQSGRLRISFTEASSSYGVVPETIRAFQSERPKIELTLTAMESPAQFDAVTAGRVDAAFLNGSAEYEAELETREVQIETLQLASLSSHPLGTRPQLSLIDLQDEPLILISRAYNPRLHDELTAAFAQVGLRPRIVQEVSTSAIMLNLVAVGIGLGITVSAMRGRLPAGVVLRPISDLTMPYCLHLAWRRDNHSPLLADFVGVALAHRYTGSGHRSRQRRSQGGGGPVVDTDVRARQQARQQG
jgi:DNA-binding transcriptional LysR family regulator